MAADDAQANIETQRFLITLVFEDYDRFIALLRVTRLLRINFEVSD
jgi:hypothetical protein